MTYQTSEGPVRLRPITLADCDVVEANPQTPENDSYDWFGFRIPGRMRRQVESGEVFPAPGATTGRLAIEADGQFVGSVSWFALAYGPNRVECVNFGIGLFPWARGKGYGTEAQRQLVDYLFATTPVNRVEASTDVENLPEQKSLEKVGLLREGVIRGCQFRNGEWRDLVGYAITRADHVELQKARAAAAKSSVTTGFSA